MSRRWLSALLLVAALGWGSPVRAASGLEAVRAEASRVRGQVSEVRSRQMGLRQELNRLASRIQALKAEGGGRLVGGGELDASLKRSQEISGTLGELARELQLLEGQAQQKNLALAQALHQELEALRAQIERSQDRTERQALVERMRQLRTERESLRPLLPAGSSLPELHLPSTDDPEDLQEQADAFRDSEDKVRQKMRALEARIAEVKQERDLDRRMTEFLEDEALFDESDRRLRVRRTRTVSTSTSEPAQDSFQGGGTPAPATVEVDSPSSAPAGPSAPASMEGPSDTPPQTAPQQFPGSTAAGRGSETGTPAPGSATGRAPQKSTTGSTGGSTQLHTVSESVGGVSQLARGAGIHSLAGRAAEPVLIDLETGDLKALQSQLEKLRKAAESYGKKAEELEKKARSPEVR